MHNPLTNRPHPNTWHRLATTFRAAAERSGDSLSAIWALQMLGKSPLESFEQRRSHLDDARALACMIGDQTCEADVLNAFARLLKSKRLFAESVPYLQDALAISQKSRVNVGRALNNLGDAYLETGRLEEATELLQQAVISFEADGHVIGQGVARGNLGEAQRRTGRLTEARAQLEHSLDLLQRAGESRSRPIQLWQLGLTERDLGNLDHAHQLWQEALSLVQAESALADDDIEHIIAQPDDRLPGPILRRAYVY